MEAAKCYTRWSGSSNQTRDDINRWALSCKNHVDTQSTRLLLRRMIASSALLATIMRSANSSTITTMNGSGICLYSDWELNSSTLALKPAIFELPPWQRVHNGFPFHHNLLQSLAGFAWISHDWNQRWGISL